MFTPAPFKIQDQAQIKRFLQENPFATLTANVDGRIVGTHLPINRHKDGKLYGHLARANPHSNLSESDEALLIFTGPHAYISPRWYEPGLNVPTWNYSAVHIYGRLRFIDEPEEVLNLLRELTTIFEGEDGWSLPDDEGYNRLVKAIRCFEFLEDETQAKFKFSQNRGEKTIEGVIAGLREAGDGKTADFMADLYRQS